MPFSSLPRWVLPFLLVSLGTASACTVAAPDGETRDKAGGAATLRDMDASDLRFLVRLPKCTGYWIKNQNNEPLVGLAPHCVNYDVKRWCANGGKVTDASTGARHRCETVVAESRVKLDHGVTPYLDAPAVSLQDIAIIKLASKSSHPQDALRLAAIEPTAGTPLRALGFPHSRQDAPTVTENCSLHKRPQQILAHTDLLYVVAEQGKSISANLWGHDMKFLFNERKVRHRYACLQELVKADSVPPLRQTRSLEFPDRGTLALKAWEDCAYDLALTLHSDAAYHTVRKVSGWSHSCVFSPGNSGGPLLTADGNTSDVVWGMTNAFDTDLGNPGNNRYYIDPIASFVSEHRSTLERHKVVLFTGS